MPLLGSKARVRCACWQCQQRLNAAQTRCQDWNSGPLHELLRLRGGALDLETQHAAEPGKQLARTLVLRMAFEARIVDPRDGRVSLEEAGNLQCTLILLSHPQCQGLQSAL